MKPKKIITDISTRIKEVTGRFTAAAYLSCALFALAIYGIYASEPVKIYDSLLTGTAAALAFAAALKLFFEAKDITKKPAELILPLVWGLGWCLLDIYGDGFGEYLFMAYAGVHIALVFLCAYFVYCISDEDSAFGYMLKSAVFTGFISLAVMLGCFLCITAFNVLLAKNGALSRLYLVAGSFSFVVIGINLLLSYVPKKGQQLNIPRAYNVFVSYVALPVYLIFIGILYIYCIKILINWKLPVGEINWFASFALMFYVMFYFGLRTQKSAVARATVKWGGLALLPVIAVQCVCIAVRISAYGLTTARWLSLACLAFGLLVIAHSVSKIKLRYLFIAGAVIALLVTVTPLNALDIPQRNQEKRLKAVLEKYEMYDGGAITPNYNITLEDRQTIVSCYDYLKSSDAKKSKFTLLATDADSFYKLYGFSPNSDVVEYAPSWYWRANDDQPIDIEGYSRMYGFASYDNGAKIEMTLEAGERVSYDLRAFIEELTEKYPTEGDCPGEIIYFEPVSGVKAALNYIFITEDEEGRFVCDITGFLLLE